MSLAEQFEIQILFSVPTGKLKVLELWPAYQLGLKKSFK